MSVERLADGGGGRRVTAAAGAALLAAAVLAGVPRNQDTDGVDRPPETRSFVTLVEKDARRDAELMRLGLHWRRTFQTLTATMPVLDEGAARPAAVVVDPGTGRRSGVLWRDEVTLGPRGEWLLAVQVTRRAADPRADACLPDRWGMAGARVSSCEILVDDDSTVLVRATCAAAHMAADPSAPGWTFVADVRNRSEQVQVLLRRLFTGTSPPPLPPATLETMARDGTWFGG